MSVDISNICLKATEAILGNNQPNLQSISAKLIENPIRRLDTQANIDVSQIPESTIKGMAHTAGWYVSDNSLHLKSSDPCAGEVRQRIAEHLLRAFPELVQYRRADRVAKSAA